MHDEVENKIEEKSKLKYSSCIFNFSSSKKEKENLNNEDNGNGNICGIGEADGNGINIKEEQEFKNSVEIPDNIKNEKENKH